jgi:hypothetical protein
MAYPAAAVAAITPHGSVRPLAIVATPQEIIDEIHLDPAADELPGAERHAPRPAKIGDYDIQVHTEPGVGGRPRPLAVLTSPWIEEHLLL